MKLLVLLSVLFSTQVFAQTTTQENLRFTYWGNEGRNRIFVSCWYAQNAVEDILDQIGAENVRTTCFGGIDQGPARPVSLNVSYDLPVQTSEVEIRSDWGANCFFDIRFIDELTRRSNRLNTLSGRSTCFRPDTRYHFRIEITE